MTVGAHGLSAVTGKHHAVLYLVEILLDHPEETVDSFETMTAMPQKIFLGLQEFGIGAVDGKISR